MKYVLTMVLFCLLAPVAAQECVVLLHGLIRSSGSMDEMENALIDHGFSVANIDYPSRNSMIEELANFAVPAGIEECQRISTGTISFVTHSLGGILVRHYFSGNRLDSLGRVVMLAPPNHGSEAVDYLRDAPGFEFINGPAGLQLGTEGDAFVKNMGGVEFELGVIAGTRSINPVFSRVLPGEDDGKVTVASARVDGMCAFTTLPSTHTFITTSNEVISETINFLKTGRFEAADAEYPDCRRNSLP